VSGDESVLILPVKMMMPHRLVLALALTLYCCTWNSAAAATDLQIVGEKSVLDDTGVALAIERLSEALNASSQKIKTTSIKPGDALPDGNLIVVGHPSQIPGNAWQPAKPDGFRIQPLVASGRKIVLVEGDAGGRMYGLLKLAERMRLGDDVSQVRMESLPAFPLRIFSEEGQLLDIPIGYSGMAWEVVDGGTLQNVTIDNVRIRQTLAPIFVRFGDRGRHLKGQPRLPPGTIRNLTISNVQAEGAWSMGCPIVALTGHPIENLTLKNVSITFAGGGTRQHAELRFDEKKKAGKYPESAMFGDRMPAFGLYCWHVKGLTLDNVRLKTVRPDQRPAIALDDAANVVIDGGKVGPNDRPPNVRFRSADAPSCPHKQAQK
jgi:hypothetical protein